MRTEILTSLVLSALVATVTASPAPHLVLHERRDAPLKNWVKRDTLQAKTRLPMRIGLTQSNLDRGHGLLMETYVSHPLKFQLRVYISSTSLTFCSSQHDSPKYGQHYTSEEIVDLFAPSQDAVDVVRAWLESAGIAAHRIGQSANKQWIQFDADTAEAEALLKTKYHVYEHIATGRTNIGCDEYVSISDSSCRSPC